MSEATALPTEQQPLAHTCLQQKLAHFQNANYNASDFDDWLPPLIPFKCDDALAGLFAWGCLFVIQSSSLSFWPNLQLKVNIVKINVVWLSAVALR